MRIRAIACATTTLFLAVFIFACSDTGPQQGDNTALTGHNAGERSDREPSGQDTPGPQSGSEDISLAENSPPAITVAKLLADIEHDESILRAEATAVDEDDDDVTFDYRWEKNGSEESEKGAVLRGLKRGDKIVLTIRPYDGKEYGAETTLRTEIANTPPVIVRNDDFSFEDVMFKKQIKATDADGDKLSYKLVKGPKGMKIDPSSGMLSWQVPDGLTGDIAARVSVSDGQGGEVFYDIVIPISVSEEKKQQ